MALTSVNGRRLRVTGAAAADGRPSFYRAGETP